MLENLENNFSLLGGRLVMVKEAAPALSRDSTVNSQ